MGDLARPPRLLQPVVNKNDSSGSRGQRQTQVTTTRGAVVVAQSV